MSPRYLLYTRTGCELCDSVEAAMKSLEMDFACALIDDDLSLLSAYGTRIPVIRDCQDKSELAYPFDGAQLAQWAGERQ